MAGTVWDHWSEVNLKLRVCTFSSFPLASASHHHCLMGHVCVGSPRCEGSAHVPLGLLLQ